MTLLTWLLGHFVCAGTPALEAGSLGRKAMCLSKNVKLNRKGKEGGLRERGRAGRTEGERLKSVRLSSSKRGQKARRKAEGPISPQTKKITPPKREARKSIS